MKEHAHKRSCISRRAEEYLEQLRTRRYSPRSVETYGRALLDFIASGKKTDVRAIGRRDLEQYRAQLLDRGFRPASVAVYIQALKLFFRYLEENQAIFENPAAGLDPIRMTRTLQTVPTEAEMAILLSAPDTGTPMGVRDRALLETAYSTGVRRQELVEMRLNAVDLAQGRVRVMGKGSRERMVPLGAEAVR
jgi:integrase/recombinase XerD